MLSSLIEIIIGMFVAFILPGWVKFGDAKGRSFIQLVLNVVGIIIILSGVIHLLNGLG